MTDHNKYFISLLLCIINKTLEEKIVFKYAVIIIAYIVTLVLCVLNSMFFKYHIKLVLVNSTTIESLDPENKENVKVRLDIIYFKKYLFCNF